MDEPPATGHVKERGHRMSHYRMVTAGIVALLTIGVWTVAGSAGAGVPEQAHGDVQIMYNRYAFTVCTAGFVSGGGSTGNQWLLEINGARSDGTVIHERVAGSGTRFHPSCQGIPRYESSYGALVATLSFSNTDSVGGGGAPPGVVAGGEGSWGLNTATSFGT